MIIRKGTQDDLPQVLALVKELAIYEKAPDEVENNLEMMLDDGFGEKPVYEFFVVEEDAALIGLALYYYRYSTWKGKCLYLEDLIVTASHRGKGIGKLLFDKIIERAKETNARGIQWQVLDWNTPAIEFYKKYDARFDDEWVNCALSKAQIDAC